MQGSFTKNYIIICIELVMNTLINRERQTI